MFEFLLLKIIYFFFFFSHNNTKFPQALWNYASLHVIQLNAAHLVLQLEVGLVHWYEDTGLLSLRLHLLYLEPGRDN